MIRRSFLRKLAAIPAATSQVKLKILMKSAWGSDDPTKAAFPFLHGDALSEAGHEIQTLETDLAEYGAKFGNPKILEWADKIITE
jgi:hypothetical protein